MSQNISCNTFKFFGKKNFKVFLEIIEKYECNFYFTEIFTKKQSISHLQEIILNLFRKRTIFMASFLFAIEVIYEKKFGRNASILRIWFSISTYKNVSAKCDSSKQTKRGVIRTLCLLFNLSIEARISQNI